MSRDQTPLFSVTLEDGREVPVRLRRNARAKRLVLRMEGAGAVVTLPNWAPQADGLTFAQDHAKWIEARLPLDDLALQDGGTVPFRGVPHLIRHEPDARGLVWVGGAPEMPELHVAGGAPYLARRLTDFFKREARAALETRTKIHAAALGVELGRFTVRDTKSRWGSCAANGNLNFSWRLILAPDEVLDYVAAHEVAHRIEHNHSPQFWALVDQLVPDMAAQKRWLKRHGQELMRIG